MSKKFEQVAKKRYSEIKSSIKTGDIFFASGNYPVSRMISHFSESIFSHVGIVFVYESNVLLLESVEDDGVRQVSLEHYISDYENSGEMYSGRLFLGRYENGIRDYKCTQMLHKAFTLLNKNYDKGEIGKILARVTMGIGNHSENNTYICSEFVDVCFKEIDIVFPRDKNGFIFPSHIAECDDVNALYEIIS